MVITLGLKSYHIKDMLEFPLKQFTHISHKLDILGQQCLDNILLHQRLWDTPMMDQVSCLCLHVLWLKPQLS